MDNDLFVIGESRKTTRTKNTGEQHAGQENNQKHSTTNMHIIIIVVFT
jgi:hypothetical protein